MEKLEKQHPSCLSSVSWNSGISESIFQLHVPRQPEPSAHQRPDRWFLNLQQRLFCPCPERISGCFLPDGQYTIISAYRFDFSKQIIFSWVANFICKIDLFMRTIIICTRWNTRATFWNNVPLRSLDWLLFFVAQIVQAVLAQLST